MCVTRTCRRERVIFKSQFSLFSVSWWFQGMELRSAGLQSKPALVPELAPSQSETRSLRAAILSTIITFHMLISGISSSFVFQQLSCFRCT